MQLTDAVALIQAADADKVKATTWADLGCGKGMFTYALAHLLSPNSTIYAIDKSSQKLQSTAESHVNIAFHRMDFVKEALPISSLSGVLMANSLHFVKDKATLISRLKTHLVAYGKFIIIEYNTMRSNFWVPYPLDTAHLQQLFASAGFESIKKLGERPSAYSSNKIVACEFTRFRQQQTV